MVGRGGGGGAYANRLPLVIPSGVTTCAVTVGLGGAAVTNTAATTGNTGGISSFAMGGQTYIALGGGAGGDGTAGSASGGSASPAWGAGITGSGGNGASQVGETTNGASLFGAPASFTPGGVQSAPASTAYGFGSGGLGARGDGATSVSSAAGRDGAFFLEFVEGV